MNYLYEATDPAGKTVVGKVEALDEHHAHGLLADQGLSVVSLGIGRAVSVGTVKRSAVVANDTSTAPAPLPHNRLAVPSSALAPVSATPAAGARITFSGSVAHLTPTAPGDVAYTTPPVVQPVRWLHRRVSTRDQLFFFQQFAALARSGASLYTSLESLAPRTPNSRLRKAAEQMAAAARTGQTVSSVMEQMPDVFPDHVTGLVRAGELGGFVEVALLQIADIYEHNIALYRGAWIPKAMALQAVLMVPIIQPLFPTIFPNMQYGLYMELVLFRNLPICALAIGLIWWAGRRLQSPKWRLRRDTWSLRIQPFGNLQRQGAIALFLTMLKRLYQAGLPPAAAWNGAAWSASNLAIRNHLLEAGEMVQRGSPIPEAFRHTGLFTDGVEQLVMTGHQSGEMVEMLGQAENYYREQTATATTRARFAIFRLGLMAAIIIGGLSVCWLVKAYFYQVFHYTDGWVQ
ncbi:MAG: type II secretion system F family protein [Armatimonadetes bacterium]|nr:type II secretion system F family protein [Armatimonadota bacterium]MDE2207873.1 type II secretion system F family protein [Armatimonadota bacterium]